jgi:hypothetical protein
MPEHESEKIRNIETHVLAECAKQPARIGAIAAAVRDAMQAPTMPDALIITAICNLSDAGKIVGETRDGFLFYRAANTPAPETPNA